MASAKTDCTVGQAFRVLGAIAAAQPPVAVPLRNACRHRIVKTSAVRAAVVVARKFGLTQPQERNHAKTDCLEAPVSGDCRKARVAK